MFGLLPSELVVSSTFTCSTGRVEDRARPGFHPTRIYLESDRLDAIAADMEVAVEDFYRVERDHFGVVTSGSELVTHSRIVPLKVLQSTDTLHLQ